MEFCPYSVSTIDWHQCLTFRLELNPLDSVTISKRFYSAETPEFKFQTPILSLSFKEIYLL